jgi:Druantia protein DruA/Transposase DNA-binding
LDQLSARSVGENPPSRHALVRQFCRQCKWLNRRGEPCVSSASVALKRLEKLGHVRLPPPQRRGPRHQPRQLVDDGQRLPALPKLPLSAGRIKNLHLQLIGDDKDPDHGLWNRIIIRQHPLKAAPLFGSQLRYLIRCEEGVLGAFGFGPAAFHLDCRDTWIGWDPKAHEQNRGRIICLSRCLLRSGIQCRNLMSRCYSLVLARVARDWQQRYGVKPLLVETYVDRSTYAGVSLSAANWRRLGQSSGRGRSSPAPKVRPKTPKDLWVYELNSQARPWLQARRVEPVVARSVFAPMTSQDWVAEELDGLDLGHERLEERWSNMLRSRWENPQRSFLSSFTSGAQIKGAYRLIESSQAGVSFQSLLAPHTEQTRRRMAAESVVLLAQDTTPLSYNGLAQTQGLGSMGEEGRGLWLHSLYAFRLDRIPLGCSWAHLWARPEESDTDRRNEQSVSEKESHRWIEAYQAAARMAQAMPQTQLVVCGDRESDIFELYDQSEAAPENLHLLVRAQHDRLIDEGDKLWSRLGVLPSQGSMEVKVPRRQNRPARTARLSLKWTAIEVNPPRVALKKSWKPLTLYVVMAQEIHPPSGAEPIEWVLLTDWKIDSLKMAQRMVQWYALRWGIECWHQVLKDVCGVEKRQMKSAAALARALVLDMIVAFRAQLLCRLGKESPNLPANLYYTEEELWVLEAHKDRLPQWVRSMEVNELPQTRPTEKPLLPAPNAKKKSSSTLCLLQANLLTAKLAGYWGRKSDGHPGPKTLASGLEILAKLVKFLHLIVEAEDLPRKPKTRNRPREPD